MAQIAYRCTSVESLPNALRCIASESSTIIEYSGGTNSIFNFSFFVEPKVNFEIMIAKDVIIHQTNPVQTEDFLWVRSFDRTESAGVITNMPKLPYKIDYNCISGQNYASSTYIGDLSGTFLLCNSMTINKDDEFYIFFGEDYLAIVKYKEGQSSTYLVCSSRGEQNGDGGYVLSSESVLIRQSDSHVFNNIFSGALLCYYNKFGVYRPNHPVDYVDNNYCSIGYNELTEYRQTIPVGQSRITVVYSFTHKWYGNCTCSLLFDKEFTNKLPNYNNLLFSLDDYGNKVYYVDEQYSPIMTNTLNGISLLLPNYFFIDVAPLSTHEYRYVFDTPEICYCSMYNMLGGNIVEQNYPTKGNKFMCFSSTTENEKNRRASAYMGFAFKLPIRYDEIIEDDEELKPLEI